MIESLKKTVFDIEEAVKNSNNINTTVNTKPIEDLVQNMMVKIEAKLLPAPTIMTRKFQVLLFPPQDAKLFYKIVLGAG